MAVPGHARPYRDDEHDKAGRRGTDAAAREEVREGHFATPSPAAAARRVATLVNRAISRLSAPVSHSGSVTSPPVHAAIFARFAAPGFCAPLNHAVNEDSGSFNSAAAAVAVVKRALTKARSLGMAGTISLMADKLAHGRAMVKVFLY